MTDWVAWAALAIAGFVAGVLNVVAGGGSFLTLPLLIFLGLPPSIANGTNRVGVLTQNVGGVWGFHRHAVLDWGFGWKASVPALAGAAIGAWGALHIGDEAFKRILALLMVAVTLWTVSRPGDGQARQERTLPPGVFILGFFLVGLYSGFVQAGVGFFVLAITTLAGLDLVQGNAVKVLIILLTTVLALGIFGWQGRVDWPMGLALGAGNLLGGQVGVKLTVLKGHRFVQGVVTVTVVLFAVKLWWS